MSKELRNLDERNDIDKLRQKYKEQERKGSYDISKVKGWLETVTNAGEFPDIDYKDFSREGFSLSRHIGYITQMARAYIDQNSELFENEELKEKIDSAIKNWTDNHYQCDNWWNNQIGTPKDMTILLYVLDEYLSPQQVDAMLAISGDANLDASGARPGGDRVVIAEIFLKNACFKREVKEVEFALEIIQAEVHFAGEGNVEQKEGYMEAAPGIERDYCFHHRTDGVNNSLTYGLNYINTFMSVATAVADTQYKFKVESTKILIDYFLEGICKQMVYSCYLPEGLLNREICRKQSERRESPTLVNQLLQIGNGYREDELENVLALRNGDYEENPEIIPSFAKFFWKTELFTFQRPGLFSSVRMFSKRNNNMEYPYNGEGTTNHFRADGTNYIQVTGTEYTNIAPIFDFRKVPGATILQDKDMPSLEEIVKKGKNDFTGGVTDGLYGAAAFDFMSPHYDLNAKKSWFYFDDEYICLGSNINSKEDKEIFTTLEQNYHQGDASVQFKKDKKSTEEKIELGGEKNFTDAQWVHHGLVGYYFLDEAKIGIKNVEVTGSWTRLNDQKGINTAEIKGKVFTLWIDHGIKPENGTYAYTILPNVTAKETKNYKSPIEILANNENLQAVRHKDLGISYGVFYKKGSIKLENGIEINTSCMIMIKEKKGKISQLSISDPNRKETGINLKIKGKFESEEKIVKYKYDKENDITNAEFSLPQGDYLGQSINIDNEYKEKKEEKSLRRLFNAKRFGTSQDNWLIIFAIIAVLLFICSLGLLFRIRKPKNNGSKIKNEKERLIEKVELVEQKH